MARGTTSIRPPVRRFEASIARRIGVRILVILWLSIAHALMVVAGVTEESDKRYFLDIPQAKAEQAIKMLSRQTGYPVIFQSADVTDIETYPLKGRYTLKQALTELFKGTALSAGLTRREVITISRNSNDNNGERHLVNTKKSFLATVIGFLVGAGGANIAAAQSDYEVARESTAVLEEVIVTAQKRDENLMDVPVPVHVLAATKLADKSQYRLQDYYQKIPGLAMTPNEASGAPSIAIRGITSGASVLNPTVSVLVDDLQFGSSTSDGGGFITPDFDPSDLAQIEVLRGPQGTLYGASSIGGLIKYVTVNPSTDKLHGRVQLGASDVAKGGTGYTANAAVNVPISDTFAVRLSGFTREDPGYIDNIRLTGERDVNETDVWGGHIAALWLPTDDLSVKLSAVIQENEVSGWPYITKAPGIGDMEQSFLPNTGLLKRNFQAYSMTVEGAFDGFDLTWLTGYSESELKSRLDFTESIGELIEIIYPATRDSLNLDDTATEKFSQELRISTQFGSRVEVLGGIFYTRENSPWKLVWLAADPNGQPIGDVATINWVSTFEEAAAFTNLTLQITDRFDVQLGARYSHLKQTYKETDTGPLIEPDSPYVIPKVDTTDNQTIYLLTPRFKLTPDMMLYARFASGYRPGGINAGLINFADLSNVSQVYSPDTTENYELGMKGSVLDGRLSFDASLYHISWKDTQISLFDPDSGQNYFTNGSEAKSDGVELSLQLIVSEALRVDGWVAWNNAELTEALPAESTAFGRKGTRLPYSSELSASVSADYEFPLAGKTGFVGSTLSYIDDRVGAFLGDATPREVFPSYTQIDIHGGIEWDQWTVNVYVNNLSDRRGVLGGGVGTIPPTAFQVIQPRTIGFSMVRTFE